MLLGGPLSDFQRVLVVLCRGCRLDAGVDRLKHQLCMIDYLVFRKSTTNI